MIELQIEEFDFVCGAFVTTFPDECCGFDRLVEIKLDAEFTAFKHFHLADHPVEGIDSAASIVRRRDRHDSRENLWGWLNGHRICL